MNEQQTRLHEMASVLAAMQGYRRGNLRSANAISALLLAPHLAWLARWHGEVLHQLQHFSTAILSDDSRLHAASQDGSNGGDDVPASCSSNAGATVCLQQSAAAAGL
jgi:hypothetical protein